MEKVTLNLNDLASGAIQLSTFQDTVGKLDAAQYAGKHVVLKGCAPTWAHLMVAGKLFGKVGAVDFLLDDGKEGRPIQVF